MVKAHARLLVVVVLCACPAVAGAAQDKPEPGPTAPPSSLPVPKGGEDLIINPTLSECRTGWRPGLRWSKQEFDNFCRQLEISK